MIHSLAYIHPEATIGNDVTIDPFVTIEKDVVVGDGTHIMSNATLLAGSRVGKKCTIFPGAVIGAVPQDLKFRGEYSTAEIGDNTTVRECVTVNRGTAARGKTTVGNNCLLMAYVHVAHDCEVGNNVILVNNTQLAGEVVVNDFAILAGMVAVHQFVRIGAHVMIAGGSLVRKDVPPYVKAGREPISYVGINSIGLRRRNMSPEKVQEIHDIYRYIYQSNLNTSQAIATIEAEMPASPERDEIINFIKGSKRGIIRGGVVGSTDED